MNGKARKKARNESVGKPGIFVAGLSPAERDREQGGREDEREDDVRRLARGPQHRAARDLADLGERRSRAFGLDLLLSSAAPSRERPVLARKTSSRLGACSSSCSSLIPSASSARTIPARSSTPCSSRTATPFGEPSVRSPNCSRMRAIASGLVPSAGIASTVDRPICAFSCSGVPSATIFPWSMIPTRSASASASSRYCVVRKTVTPSSRASRATSTQSALRLCEVEAGRRLVEEEDRRPVREREREVEPALHAAGVAADLAVGRAASARRARAAPARGPCAPRARSRAARTAA